MTYLMNDGVGARALNSCNYSGPDFVVSVYASFLSSLPSGLSLVSEAKIRRFSRSNFSTFFKIHVSTVVQEVQFE